MTSSFTMNRFGKDTSKSTAKSALLSSHGGSIFNNMSLSRKLTKSRTIFKNMPNEGREMKVSPPSSPTLLKKKFSTNYFLVWIDGWKNGTIGDAELHDLAMNADVEIEIFSTPLLSKVVKEPWAEGGKITNTVVVGTVNGEPIHKSFTYTPATGPKTVPGSAGDAQVYLA